MSVGGECMLHLYIQSSALYNSSSSHTLLKDLDVIHLVHFDINQSSTSESCLPNICNT